ncbi:MAG: class I SAM-dependent methyltransferase [Elusimicrobia bacterium]|nr:class I SAM-dependent methyltransferase [Elusimicrobiota bacterium]
MTLKEEVRRFWDKVPCGTRDVRLTEGSPEYFSAIEQDRDAKEPFIADFARFSEQRGKRVLEVGFGAGTDFVRFARAGAVLTGIDLTEHGARLVRARLAHEGLSADIHVGDAENLPFADGTFDLVYSWGVIHHTEDTPRAAREIARVVKPGGRVCVMVYHRHSLVALQCWILNALLRGRPWRTLSDVIFHHIESLGTQAYSLAEAKNLFSSLSSVAVTPRLTPYDVRITRNKYLPVWLRRFIPNRMGWFLVIEGIK